MEFHGGQAVASVCAREGWAALRGAMRTWGVADCEELSNWLGRQGFPRTTPGNHISARAQEFILGGATTLDARCALLEAVFVLVTVNVVWEMTGTVDNPRCHQHQSASHHQFRLTFSRSVGSSWIRWI